jgi:hypothetical protein
MKLNMIDLTLRGSEELNIKTPRMAPLCDIVTDFLLLLIYNCMPERQATAGRHHQGGVDHEEEHR